MPLLLYCVALQEARGERVEGVCGVPVWPVELGGLQYFVSEIERPAIAAADVATSARAVHAVVMDVFAKGPVLPFRYPTILEDEAELKKLDAERGKAFTRFLQWVGARVQMDVRLTLRQQKQQSTKKEPLTAAAKAGRPPLGITGQTSGTSGTEYLKERARRKSALRDAAEKCRPVAVSAEWRLEERDNILICHVLLERVEVVSFQERMSSVELPVEVTGVVSGPWPPAGFWEEKPR